MPLFLILYSREAYNIMNLNLLLNQGSQILVIILFILTMMLRSSKQIPNWMIQWIVLVVALPLSYLQIKSISIDVIMNAFVATGVCVFGENAIFRKSSEKTEEEHNILKLIDLCKEQMDESKSSNNENMDENEKNIKSTSDIDGIEDTIQKIIREINEK